MIQKCGKIDILVNNAGISQRSLAEQTKFEVDQEMIIFNVLCTISFTKYVLRDMIVNRGGHIVVMGSVAGNIEF